MHPFDASGEQLTGPFIGGTDVGVLAGGNAEGGTEDGRLEF